MKTEITVAVQPPPAMERKTKEAYANTGIDQILMADFKGRVFSYFYGRHREEHLCFGLPNKNKKGGHALKSTLSSIRRGVEIFGDSFHLRHHMNRYSTYLTYSVVEEEWSCRANKLEAAHIRALLDMNPITVFDLSAKTARLRELCTRESSIIGYERYLKKK